MGYGWLGIRRAYDLAPGWIRSVFATAYGGIHKRRKYGEHFRQWLALLQQTERAEPGCLEDLELTLLRGFLQRAAREVPFWRDRLQAAGIDPGGVRTPADLKALPPLEKEEVRAKQSDLWPDWVRRGGVVWYHTSGTTGKALTVPVSTECLQREYAFRWLHYGWTGIRQGDRVATFAGHPVVPPSRRRPPFWVYNAMERQLIFSAQHLGPREGQEVAKRLARFRPDLIHGYPSALALVAQAVLEADVEIPSLKGVYTASETLLEAQQNLIARAFRCPVMNWYGNTEMVANIVACPEGCLHVQVLHSWVEILRPDGSPAREGEEGELVCTGFGNSAMPLIRYRVGDRAVVSGAGCRCGRTTPTVAAVTGRVEDYVVTPSGRLVGRLDHVFKDSLSVREAQLIQDRPDHLRIVVVPRPEFDRSRDEAVITAHLRERLEPQMSWTFEYVDEIPRGPTGKFRFVVSEVDAPWARAAAAALSRRG
jgi:phenylacetate-CoA ligase